jgi:hypothetical protein
MKGVCHLLEGNPLILLEADFKVPVCVALRPPT